MLRALLILAGVFFVMLILTGALAMWVGGFFPPSSRAGYLCQSAVQALLAFAGTAAVVAKFVSRRPAGFLGLTQSVTWRPFVGVLIVYALAMPFLNQLIYYNSLMTLPEALAPLENYMRQMEEMNGKVVATVLAGDSIWVLLSGILVIGVLTGFGEEMLFRGALQRSLDIYPPMRQWAIWISAVIFSAVHLQFFGFFPRLLLGAFFGYLLYSSGSLWPGVFAHALNNSIVVVATWLSERGVIEGDADSWGVVRDGFPIWGVVSLAALVIFFIFGYRYFFVARQAAKCESIDSSSY